MSSNTNVKNIRQSPLLPGDTTLSDIGGQGGTAGSTEAEAKAKAAAEAKAAQYDGVSQGNRYTGAGKAPGYTASMGGSQEAYDAVNGMFADSSTPMPSSAEIAQTAQAGANNPAVQNLTATTTQAAKDIQAGADPATVVPKLADEFGAVADQLGVNVMSLITTILMATYKEQCEQSAYHVGVLKWYGSAQKQMSGYLDMLAEKRQQLDDKVVKAKDKDKNNQQITLPYRMTDINFSSPDADGNLQYVNAGEVRTYGPNDIPAPTQSKQGKWGSSREWSIPDPADASKTLTTKANNLDDAKSKLAKTATDNSKSESAKQLNMTSTGMGQELTRTQQYLDQLSNMQNQKSQQLQQSEQAKNSTSTLASSLIKTVGDSSAAIRRNIQ